MNIIITAGFRALISLFCQQNWALNFGNFQWCSKSPYGLFYLVILSSLLGVGIGRFSSLKRSRYLAKLMFRIFLLLSITQYTFLSGYKEKVSELIRDLENKGRSTKKILKYIADHYPVYYYYAIVRPQLPPPEERVSLLRSSSLKNLFPIESARKALYMSNESSNLEAPKAIENLWAYVD